MELWLQKCNMAPIASWDRYSNWLLIGIAEREIVGLYTLWPFGPWDFSQFMRMLSKKRSIGLESFPSKIQRLIGPGPGSKSAENESEQLRNSPNRL